jgi:hypothetical protein
MKQFPNTYRNSAPALVHQFFRFVMDCVCSDSIELSDRASELAIQIITKDYSSNARELMSICVDSCNRNNTDSQIKLRFASMFCTVAGSDSSHFSTCYDAGCLDIVDQMCHSSDMLIQVRSLISYVYVLFYAVFHIDGSMVAKMDLI